MTTVKHLIEHLKNNYKPNAHIATSIWQRDDVLCVAQDWKTWDNEQGTSVPNPMPMTEKQADEIVEEIDRHHDCTIGINCDVLEHWVGEFAHNKRVYHLEEEV